MLALGLAASFSGSFKSFADGSLNILDMKLVDSFHENQSFGDFLAGMSVRNREHCFTNDLIYGYRDSENCDSLKFEILLNGIKSYKNDAIGVDFQDESVLSGLKKVNVVFYDWNGERFYQTEEYRENAELYNQQEGFEIDKFTEKAKVLEKQAVLKEKDDNKSFKFSVNKNEIEFGKPYHIEFFNESGKKVGSASLAFPKLDDFYKLKENVPISCEPEFEAKG